MFVRSRDHIDKNVSAQDIRDKRNEILPTLRDKTEVELRVLMSSAAIQLQRKKGMRREQLTYEYSSFCFLPRKLVVKKGNEYKVYNYSLFNNDGGRSLLKTAQSLSTRNEGYKLLKCMGFVKKEAWKVDSPESFTMELDTLIHSTLKKSVLQSDRFVDISNYYIATLNDDRVDLFSSFYKHEVYCGTTWNNVEQLGNLLLMWNYNGVVVEKTRQKLCVILDYDLQIERNDNMEWTHNYYFDNKKFIIDEESQKLSIIGDELIDGDENGDEDNYVDGVDDDEIVPGDQQQEDEVVPGDDDPNNDDNQQQEDEVVPGDDDQQQEDEVFHDDDPDDDDNQQEEEVGSRPIKKVKVKLDAKVILNRNSIYSASIIDGKRKKSSVRYY